MEEVWKRIEEFPSYEVSNQGRVRRIVYLTLSESSNRAHRYLRVGLSGGGRHKTVKVHQLVAAAFLGPCPEGKCVDHRDFNRLNNASDNLEYVTVDENIRRAIAAGVIQGRVRVHQDRTKFHTRLTPEQVQEIKRLLPTTSMSRLAKLFGVSAEAIRLIKIGKLWRPD